MRIIAGRLGGRSFRSPRGRRTHPMSDKGRGALFNALGDISGLNVLDAFAGSGALSFEAVSRGALRAVAIDRDRSAQAAIAANIAALGLGGSVKLIRAGAAGWLATTSEAFDLVLLDPPFEALQPELLVRLADRTKPGGVAVLSLPPTAQVPVSPAAAVRLPAGFAHQATKTYGDSQLVFYRRTG